MTAIPKKQTCPFPHAINCVALRKQTKAVPEHVGLGDGITTAGSKLHMDMDAIGDPALACVDDAVTVAALMMRLDDHF